MTVALSSLLVPLNSTMVAVALPELMSEFQVDIATAGWLVTGYLIAMASVQPIAGGLGDRYGRRRLIIGGLAGFGVASIGAGLASSFPLLVLCRLAQAFAGALVMPNGVALVRETVPMLQRARTFGWVGAALGVGAAVGPAVGGVLVGYGDWRAIFAINVPLVAVLLVLAWRFVPALPQRSTGSAFDLPGSLLLCALLAGTAWVLTQGARTDFGGALPASVLVLLAVAGVFIWHGLRAASPVVDPRFFAQRSFSAASAGVALSNLAMYSTLLLMPQLLPHQIGWHSTEVGLALVALSGSMVVLGPLGGQLADRLGRRRPVLLGFGLLTVGVLVLPAASHEANGLLMLAGLALTGLGLGLSQSGLQSAAIESVSVDRAGAAAGVYSTSRYLGSIVGSSLLSALLSTSPGGIDGYDAVFSMVAVAALLSVIAGAAMQDWPERRSAPAAETSAA